MGARKGKNKGMSSKLHPDDAASQSESVTEGHQHARAFCIAHAEAMIDLISTYADSSAEEKLQDLRAHFWGNDMARWQKEADEWLRAELGKGFTKP